MNEIIKVDFDTQTVSARALHNEVGSTERFSTWFERQLQFGFVENEDYTSVKSFTVVNNGAKRELDDYDLSVDMAKQICMVQKNEKAKMVRQYLIDLEKAWNAPEQVFARALKMADATIESLKNKNTVLLEENTRMKPKEIFADAVSASHTSILIGELAKILKQNGIETGEKRLFAWLRDKGYLISRKGTDYNAPTQRAMELGLFEVKETAINHSDGHVTVNKTTKVTGKGQQYFINKFLVGKSRIL